MGITSNSGLMAVPQKTNVKLRDVIENPNVELRCEVTPAPFMLRPYAGLYNPFSPNCSVLCNHPAHQETKECVKRAKESWVSDGKLSYHLEASGDQENMDKDKMRSPHDIVTEDMFRRYTETDSRPLTPAPTLASSKSRGSRRCLTPDHPHSRTKIVVDLRRRWSGQETLYYHGYTTSDMTGGQTTDQSGHSVNQSDQARLVQSQCQQLPPLALPVVLARRNVKEPVSVQGAGAAGIKKKCSRIEGPNKNQLKALNLGKQTKGKGKQKEKDKEDTPQSQGSKEKDLVDGIGSDGGLDNVENNMNDGGSGEARRRGKRRRKGRAGGSDRLTSAGLAAQSQQDPETQVAGIGTDSHNPSSRGSIAPASEAEVFVLPVKKGGSTKMMDSFIDADILKYLHREVDEEAIETEFDTIRRYVLKEAMRTRPDRPYGKEMQSLVKELNVPANSLGDWLHIPRVFSRQNAQFTLPLDSRVLTTLTPMQYAAWFVTSKKSKQLLYLTVLKKFTPDGYRMPINDIEEGLVLMMGGIMKTDQVKHFRTIMEWDSYEEQESIPDEIKLAPIENDVKRNDGNGGDGDTGHIETQTIKYQTWCGLCGICERMYGRYPPRKQDPPDGIEMSDFTTIDTKLATLKIHPGLVEILHVIKDR